MQDQERLGTTLSIIIQNTSASFRRFLCGTVVRGKHQKGENMVSWNPAMDTGRKNKEKLHV